VVCHDTGESRGGELGERWGSAQEGQDKRKNNENRPIVRMLESLTHFLRKPLPLDHICLLYFFEA
jgi:hypothetical protein